MTVKIKCNLSNLEKAVEGIEKYQKSLDEKIKTLMKKLAEIGVDEASIRFKNAIYDGTNDVTVQPYEWVDENKIVISATGNSITFIEFGSGVHYAEEHPKASEFGYTRGGYGYKLGRWDSWRYSGDPGTNGEVISTGIHKGEILTHGNPANRCMYDSVKTMREHISKIIEEVFKND